MCVYIIRHVHTHYLVLSWERGRKQNSAVDLFLQRKVLFRTSMRIVVQICRIYFSRQLCLICFLFPLRVNLPLKMYFDVFVLGPPPLSSRENQACGKWQMFNMGHYFTNRTLSTHNIFKSSEMVFMHKITQHLQCF